MTAVPRARLIPAHAGKTASTCTARLPGRAHPRSRGENGIRSRHASAIQGSSPLTRGKPRVITGQRESSGLIPAHAGKTSRSRFAALWRGAHPRSRGENPVFLEIPGKGTGSSPLTRGKPLTQFKLSGSDGLIPAHAGKTAKASGSTMPSGAHPRSRGENSRSRRK